MYDERYGEEQEAKYKTALVGVKPRGLVLDVGCGTGLFSNHVASEAEKVVGVDFSKELLLKAKERAETLENVDLVQADADHLPFRNDLFDVVFAFTMLQNMPKPLETLRETHRIARKGAVVMVTGLKKAVSLKALKELLVVARFRAVSVKDEPNLKCYVASSLK